jgi:integrase
MVAEYAAQLNAHLGLKDQEQLRLAPHDMRRTFAKLARSADSKIEQIQQSLRDASILTTERYFGTEHSFQDTPGDWIRLSVQVR